MAESLFALAELTGLQLDTLAQNDDPAQNEERDGKDQAEQDQGMGRSPPGGPLQESNIGRRAHQDAEGIGHCNSRAHIGMNIGD